jgi:hypothetical protein
VRPLYRIRQFWQAITATEPSAIPEQLAPALHDLYLSMRPADRAHAWRTFCALDASEQVDQNLAAAALLHDLGKSGASIHLWDRVLLVLAERLAAHWLARGRHGAGLRALLGHAQAGAERAAAGGASPLTVALIRYHHADTRTLGWPAHELALLVALQRADDCS